MKSEKINVTNDINNKNINSVLQSLANQPPKGSILLDKSLLPSKGVFYTEQIYIKKFSTLNIKNLATITENNADFVINNMISSCLWGIDTNKILVGDKLWLLFYLRAFTYNDLPFNVRETCKNCGTVASYSYVLKNLDVIQYDKELPEYFDINGDKIEVKFPTISTELATQKMKNDPNNVIDIDPGLLDFSSYIYKINDRTVTLTQAYEYVCEMDAMSFSKYTNTLSEYMFVTHPVGKFECPHCKQEINVVIPLSPSFFMPKV